MFHLSISWPRNDIFIQIINILRICSTKIFQNEQAPCFENTKESEALLQGLQLLGLPLPSCTYLTHQNDLDLNELMTTTFTDGNKSASSPYLQKAGPGRKRESPPKSIKEASRGIFNEPTHSPSLRFRGAF